MTTYVRRKPTITYQSPSASDSAFLPRDYGRRRHASSSSSTTSSSASSSSHTGPNANASTAGAKQQSTTIAQKTTRGSLSHHTRDTADSLSLFHPLGRLAASLPPFDPRPYGLPLLPERPSASTTSSSSRTQRKSGGQRSTNGTANANTKPSTPLKTTKTAATGTASPSGSAPLVADADNSSTVGGDVDAKAKMATAAPARKSRKRKRVVTAEDNDATYPARKTRAPRVASNQAGRRGTSEEEMLPPPMPEPEPVPQPVDQSEDSESPEFKALIEQHMSKLAEGTGSSGKEKPEMEAPLPAMDVSPDVPVPAPTVPELEKPVAVVAATAADQVVAAPVEVAPPPPAVDQKKPPPLAVVEEEEKEEGELST